MFESIVSIVRNSVRAIGALTRKSPWVMPIAILALFLVL
jgi:hypothetical protein